MNLLEREGRPTLVPSFLDNADIAAAVAVGQHAPDRHGPVAGKRFLNWDRAQRLQSVRLDPIAGNAVFAFAVRIADDVARAIGGKGHGHGPPGQFAAHANHVSARIEREQPPNCVGSKPHVTLRIGGQRRRGGEQIRPLGHKRSGRHGHFGEHAGLEFILAQVVAVRPAVNRYVERRLRPDRDTVSAGADVERGDRLAALVSHASTGQCVVIREYGHPRAAHVDGQWAARRLDDALRLVMVAGGKT